MPRKKNPHSTPYVKPDYHSQNKEKRESDDDIFLKQKKNRLRSSLDIYNRLMHDHTLNIDLNNIFIGYSDYVLGDQEMCILDWIMIDNGGDIPMHHILYFIFILNNGNKLILWDRKTKLDRLFGSGITNQKQKFNVIMNSTKIKNIQSQNKQNKKKKTKQNKNENNNDEMKIANISKMTKEIFVDDEIINKFFPRYPITDDGFVQSFDINHSDKWIKYLNHYGFVVIKVFNEKQINKTVNSMFDEIYDRTIELQEYNDRKIYKVDIDNPFTWNSFNFPKPFGKFLTDRPAFSKQAFKNRTSKKMHFIWSTIFGTKKLNCTIENWGIQRGTTNLNFVDPEKNKLIKKVKEEVKWRRNLRAHWDINPWTYLQNLESKEWCCLYQGALALSDQRMIDGTHLNLPGCTRFLKQWCDNNKGENNNPYRHNINFNDDLIKYMQPIPLRKGEMVIWNMGQLHANTKNFSERMRLSQYMRMLPSQEKYIRRDGRCVQQQMEKYKNDIDILKIMGEMDDTTMKLMGLQEW